MAIRNPLADRALEDDLGYDDLVNIVGGGSTPTAQPAPWEPLAQQIASQWKQYGISPDIKGINRANELAQILANYGITDISKLGIKETPYEEQVNVSGGGEGVADVWETVKRNRGQLTYGDQTFGRLGGFGSKGQQEFSAPQEYLQQSDPGRYGLGYSAAGKGWVEYELATGPDGKPVIVPRWGSTSDLTPELVQFLAMAAAPFTGGLSATLAPAVGAAAAPILTQALVSGTLAGAGNVAQGTGSFGSGFARGAGAGALGAVAAPYIGQLGSEAGKIVGGGPLGDIVSGAVQGAGRGAVGAVITGDSVLDAILTGAAGGAASAGTDMLVKGTNSTLGQYLKDVPAPIKNAVLSAASAGILGKDIDKAVVNSFMRDLQAQFKAAVKAGAPGQAASAGYGGADPGYFDPDAETSPLPDWALDPYKDEADVIPATYDTAPKTSMSPVEMAQFLEANIDDPGTIETLMQDYFPELYTQRIEVTPAKRETPGGIRDVGTVTRVQPGEKLEGTTVVEPDLSKNLPTVPGGLKLPAKPATPAKPAGKQGLDLDALAFLLGAMNQRPEKEEEQQAASQFPVYDDLMYGLTSRYA